MAGATAAATIFSCRPFLGLSFPHFSLDRTPPTRWTKAKPKDFFEKLGNLYYSGAPRTFRIRDRINLLRLGYNG
jgi:hypothetical protein